MHLRREGGAYFQRCDVVLDGEVGDARGLGVSQRASESLRGHLLIGDRLDHVGTCDDMSK